MDQRVLAFQILIPRILVEKLSESCLHALPHLCRRRIREGHHQQPVDIHRIFRICDHADDALNEDCRLSASCCRRYKEIPVSRLDDLFLFLCPFCRHYRISFPSVLFSGSSSPSGSISFQISSAFIDLNLLNPYPSVFRSNPHTL